MAAPSVPVASSDPKPASLASPTSPSLDASAAWEPLPAREFDAAAARHLLRRTGWAARPAEVEQALAEGLPRTLERLFPPQPAALAKPAMIANLQEDTPDFAERIRAASPQDRQLLQREARERSQAAAADLAIKWLTLAADPAAAAREKWVHFLSDIYVVSLEKVRNAALLYAHQDILRRHSLGSAPALTKAVSRSPAMVVYLDLQQSRRDAPNENFARELFELFTLGEGHYTETDIKEAARAFTGYRQQFGMFRFQARQHDETRKTVFGRSGTFGGDDVIDLAYAQPAGATFLPRELARFYLTDGALPEAHLATLGTWWRATGFDLRKLAHRVFGSRLFFAPEYRGNLIKSPVHFELGLVQDLALDVAPLPRLTLQPLRQMGQNLLEPPNVRGWVGGRTWIHSGTLAARRGFVQALFSAIDESRLNADEQVELVAARSQGRTRFVVDDERLTEFSRLTDPQIVARFVDYFLPVPVSEGFRAALARSLSTDAAASDPARRRAQVRRTAVTLLQSPEYQLC